MVYTDTLKYNQEPDGTRTITAGCESNFSIKNYETYISTRYEVETLIVSTDMAI